MEPGEKISGIAEGYIPSRVTTLANTLAVAGAVLIAFAFLILGTELLKPKGLLPEENKVAETLGQLLGGVWGRVGF